MKTAVIILNRNLPDIADRLYEHIDKYDAHIADIFILEAGSDDNNISKYTTWHEKSEEVCKNGLRYSRGMNYALNQLWHDGRFFHYDSFFLLTNDVELKKTKTIEPLQTLLNTHPKLGIISPCAKDWGERKLFQNNNILYFWYISNSAYFLKRQFIEEICNIENNDNSSNFMNFLFDGRNFRGYGAESELLAKAYINNWAAAITTLVEANENETYLLEKADLIKTDSFTENQRLYIEEGKRWMYSKYGFTSHWMMQEYVKMFYDKFFVANPECLKYKIS